MDSAFARVIQRDPFFSMARRVLCYILQVMKTQVAFGFYFWFSVLGGREANV
jgi:hypothetical protein